MIKIGSFFTTNFNINKIFVHNCCGSFIFKTLFLHYMTPMTSGIANANQYRLIFFFSFVQCFIIPAKPVNRIMCMLQKIGACFVDKLIGILMHGDLYCNWL